MEQRRPAQGFFTPHYGEDRSARVISTETYISPLVPQTIPTLIVSGSDDRIVWQDAWEEPRFRRSNVMHRTIEGGAHFPWIENPQAVQQAFSELAAKVVVVPLK
jgi:pimeloyl-ACP methyl ester carboxylesterase